jgi:ABC-type antimicrobial peptide transport system permease subunit
MTSLYSEIEPTVIRLRPQFTGLLFVRTRPGQTQEALASLEGTYHRFNPDFPFEYQFLDNRFRATYQSETVIGQLASYFTAVGLFIACLGLFGLASFTAQQRTKEIGVRKVLGATVTDLTVLLSKDFIRLVGIAFVVATPVSFVLMRYWLASNFAYQVDLGAGIFGIAGAIALLVALASTGYQAVKSALANPVKSLRYE